MVSFVGDGVSGSVSGRLCAGLVLVAGLVVSGCGDDGGTSPVDLGVNDTSQSGQDTSSDPGTWDGGATDTGPGTTEPDPSGTACIALDGVSVDLHPPGGMRVHFRVLDCDGGSVGALTAGSVQAIDNATGEAFGSAGAGGGSSDPVTQSTDHYTIGVCSPQTSATSALTLKVAAGGAEAESVVYYDGLTLGGDVSTCNATHLADPCAGRVCGDGTVAGFTCGGCPACGEVCLDGQCEFTACDGLVCGSDGCGGTCGACDGVCSEGQCYHPCAERECGDDGFGGSCGTCDTYGVCNDAGLCDYPTFSDTASGLSWQNLDLPSSMKWAEAQTYCSDLVLAGHDDWRVPSLDELRSLLRGCPDTETGGACPKTSACPTECWGNECNGCGHQGGPAAEGCYWPDEMLGKCGHYWNSVPPDNFGFAGRVNFNTADVGNYNSDLNLRIRCVR